MIRPEDLKNILYLRLSIIIRSKVYIYRSSDAKNFCNVVWIDGELFSAYLTLQLNFGISSIWIEFLDQLINPVLKVPDQISPIFCFKYPRNKYSSQGVKLDHSFHHSRSFQKNARVCLWIKRSPESFTVWVLRRTVSPFWNRGWWNINYNVFSSRGTARHLQKNQEQNPQDTNINLIRFKLVNEISARWNIERDSTQMW